MQNSHLLEVVSANEPELGADYQWIDKYSTDAELQWTVVDSLWLWFTVYSLQFMV